MRLPSWRCAIAVFILLLSGNSAADCWKVTLAGGQTIQASDVWHLHNRITDQSTFLGGVDGKESSVLTAEVRSIVMPAGSKGVFGLFRRRAHGELIYLNGRKANFSSDLALTVVSDGKRTDIPFEDIRAISRCDAPLVAAQAGDTKPAAAAKTERPASAGLQVARQSITLANGNVLHGDIVTRSFQWQAPYATLEVEQKHIRSIRLAGKNTGKGLMLTWVGDRISGDLRNDSVAIHLAIGQTVNIETASIVTIDFGGSAQ
jgi:hypothetical protein